MDLLVKVYFPDEHFPVGGELSHWLWKNAKVGDELDITGPKGRLVYEGDGRFFL